MGKGKVSKILCIMLSLMLVIGMAPANASYAASRSLGSTISSWLNSIKGSSSNKDSSSSDKVTNSTTTSESTAQSDSSGTVDDIKLTKTATDKGIDEEGNQLFDITLGVKGKKVTQGAPLDITLVVDLSNSMNDNSRLMITKDAAKEFIETVLPASGTSNVRVSIVAYGKYGYAYNFDTSKWDKYGSTSTSQYYTVSRSTAKNVIDSNSFKPGGISNDSGGTNTEAGFRTAKAVTETRNRADATSVVIFMTDGVPTYRCNGTDVSGSGSSTADADFNQAVTAANELKNAGNDIYTVGLLTGYSNLSNNLTMANKLLADDASYNVKTTNWNKKTYTNIGAAYSTKYYPITESAGAGDKIKEIYTNIANKILVLATGTVVDKIPEGFELTEDSKEALQEAGYKISEDGKTITFEGIPSGEEKKELKFTVKYTGNGYGAAYTNDYATYSGILYDGTTFEGDNALTFAKPVAGLYPKTVDDSDSTTVGTTITVNIRENDHFTKLTVDGYTVSDYTIVLTDKDGNEINYTGDFTATIEDGKLVFTSQTEGTKELYYVVKANITKKGDNFAINGQTELKSRPTKVTIDVYSAPSKAFVIDFGKPVTYSADDVFTTAEQNAQIVLKNATNNKATGNYGTMTFNSDKSITYKLTKFMDNIDQFIFNETFTDKDKVDKKVSMVPASSIYYEDDFSDEDGNTLIKYGEGWDVIGRNSVNEIKGDGSLGYDSNYDKSDSELEYSGGTIHYVPKSTKSVKADFTFTGQGLDLYSYTSGSTGKLTFRVYDESGTRVFNKTINTKYNSGEAYQVPVVTFVGETSQTYKVEIIVPKNEVFYLDAIRIYNSVKVNKDEIGVDVDNEADAKFVSIREESLTPNLFTVIGNVFIDAYTGNPAQIVDISNSDNLAKYTTYGRKTEVVLAPEQSITISLKDKSNIPTKVDLGARIDASVPSNITGGSEYGKLSVNSKDITLKSSTDMYYTVLFNDNGQLVITNNTNKLVALTKLKLIY